MSTTTAQPSCTSQNTLPISRDYSTTSTAHSTPVRNDSAHMVRTSSKARRLSWEMSFSPGVLSLAPPPLLHLCTAQERTVILGLIHRPRFIPGWYKFDDVGYTLHNSLSTRATNWYIYQAEMDLLGKHVRLIVHKILHYISLRPTMIRIPLLPDNVSLATLDRLQQKLQAANEDPQRYQERPRLSVPVNIVEISTGTINQTVLLISVLLERNVDVRYFPIAMDESTANRIGTQIQCRYADDNVEVVPIVGHYSDGLKRVKQIFQMERTKPFALVLWFSGLLNLESPSNQDTALELLHAQFGNNFLLLVASDFTHSERTLRASLNEPLHGILCKNSLLRMNRDLSANFDADCFNTVYKVVQEQNNTHCTISLQAKQDCYVFLAKAGFKLHLRVGEVIRLHTSPGTAYRWTQEVFNEQLRQTGYICLDSWLSRGKSIQKGINYGLFLLGPYKVEGSDVQCQAICSVQ